METTTTVRPGQIVVVAGRTYNGASEPADRGEFIGAADTQEAAEAIAERSGIHHRMLSYVVAGEEKLPRGVALAGAR
jgi:hypothetical protein